MTKPFITEDFLLHSREARELYERYAADAPIIDFHTHLSARDIAHDRTFDTIAEAWLETDHYKWRAMRANGVGEERITGSAPAREKFQAWAETMPYLLGNPLYHWTHLELTRYFDVDVLLGPETAETVWEACNARLPSLSCREMMRQQAVALICTTDDPADSLDDHRAIADNPSISIRVLPSWRPDKALAVDDPAAFNEWVDRLGTAAGLSIDDFDAFWDALDERHAAFHDAGCRLSDHGLDTFYAEPAELSDAAPLFDRLRKGEALTPAETSRYRSALLFAFARMDAERGWVQQYHVGPLRNNRTRLLEAVGPDAGADSMGDARYAQVLNRFLDRLDAEARLTKTIVYNINPRDTAMVATALGNFEDGSVPGKMQLGAAWWFLDHKEGIEAHLTTLARLGLLRRFVGMLTDSRSFLSFPRHEYFRRILCNFLGAEMAVGLIPHDPDLVGETVRDICCRNAETYFGFPL